jgi:hypothetical protein
MLRIILPALAVCTLLVAVERRPFAAPATQGATGDSCVAACKRSAGGTVSTSDYEQCRANCFVRGVAEDPDAGGEVTARSSPPVAAPKTSACDAVFARLRTGPSVSVWWTTNYFANGYRFMGVTALELRPRDGDLVGQGQRHRFAPGPDGLIERRILIPSTAAGPEIVTLRIRADGQIMLNDTYGPYTPICWSERFAGFHSGDSVETFNFKLQ